MTSAEPVVVTAMMIIIRMMSSPVLPMSLCATTGGTRPDGVYHSVISLTLATSLFISAFTLTITDVNYIVLHHSNYASVLLKKQKRYS